MSYPPLEPGRYYHIYNRANGSENLFNEEGNYIRFLELFEKYISPVADTIAWVLMPNHFHLLVRIKEDMYYKYRKEDFKIISTSVSDAANTAPPNPPNADRSSSPNPPNADRSSSPNPPNADRSSSPNPPNADRSSSPNPPNADRSSSPNPPNADRSSSPNPTASTFADAVGFGGFGGVRFDDVKWETINLSASEGPGSVTDAAGENEREIKKRKKASPTSHFSHLFNAYTKYINAKYNRHGSLFQRPFRRKPVDDEAYFRKLIIYIHNNPVHHGFVNYLTEYPWSSYNDFLTTNSNELRCEVVNGWFHSLKNFKAAHSAQDDDFELEEWLEEG